MPKRKSRKLLANANMQELRDAIENLGGAVIIWLPDDFPSQEDFDMNVDSIIDICIERGNEAISMICPDDEEEDEDDD